MRPHSSNLNNSNKTLSLSQKNIIKKETKLVKKINFNNNINEENFDQYTPLNNVFSSYDNLNETNSIKQILISKNKPIFLSEISSIKNASSFGSRRTRHLTIHFSQRNIKSYMKKNENLLRTFFQKTKSLENIMKQKEYEYDDLNKFKFSSKKALDDLYYNKNDLQNIIERESISRKKFQLTKKKYSYVKNKLKKYTITLNNKKNISLKNMKTYSKNQENFNSIDEETQNLFDTIKCFKKNVRLLTPDHVKLLKRIDCNKAIEEIQKAVQDDNDKNGEKYKESKENFFRKNEFYKHLIQLNNDIAYKYRNFFAERLGLHLSKDNTIKKKDKKDKHLNIKNEKSMSVRKFHKPGKLLKLLI